MVGFHLLAAPAGPEDRRLIHDAAAAVSVADSVEITVGWLAPGVSASVFLEATGAAHAALFSTGDRAAAARYGQALARVNPGCALAFYGAPAAPPETEAFFTGLFPARPCAFLRSPALGDLVLFLRGVLHALEERELFRWETKALRLQLPYEQILYFQSDRNVVRVHLAGGGEHQLTGKLDTVEAAVPSGLFLRVHQSFLVNRAAIRLVDKSRKMVTLSDGEEIAVSKARYKETLSQ